jgi:predicted nucleic acid-binding protein
VIDRRMVDLAVPRSGLVVTAPVVAELVMGARTDVWEEDLRRALAAFPDLRFHGRPDLDAGASVYRTCRQAGVTPGGLLDCVIAGIALREGAALLTNDVAQARIAEVVPLRLDPASASP